MQIGSAAPSRQLSRRLTQTVFVALLALPWLWPIANGPTPAVLPWLVSLACAALFLLLFLVRPANLNTIVAQALLVAALASSLIGLLQYFGASAALSPWISVTAPGYAFGNLRQRNQLGSLINIGLAVLVWSAWSQERLRPWCNAFSGATSGAAQQNQATGLRHWPMLLAAVLLASANAATASRTGFLQLLALPVLALVWRRHDAASNWPILLAALAAYVGASVLLPLLAGLDPLASGIVARFGETGQSCESRLVLWRNVVYLIAQKPWWGWGWGELDYAHFVTLYPDVRFCDILDNAHNLPLHLAVVFGLPFAAAVCASIAWLVWRARPWTETCPDRQMAWAVLFLVALHSLLEYPLWYGPFQLAVLLCLAILWRTPRLSPGAAGGGEPTTGLGPPAWSASVRRTVMALAVLVLAAAAYAAWDYRRVSQIYLPAERRAPAYRHDTAKKIQGSWLYGRQVRFAALTTTAVDADNAALINRMAKDLLHFSPEPRVIDKLIHSAGLLHHDQEQAFFEERYRAAFPKEFVRWRAAQQGGPAAAASDN
jgi:O-antigen ligase